MTSGPGFRLARSAIFAALCVVTTALGHALMSGDDLPGWAVGYAFAAVTSGAWWLTGRERGALAVTAATVTTQLLLHSVFTMSQLIAGTDFSGTSGTSGAGAAGLTRMSAMHADPGTHAWSPGMVLAHLLAALACAVWMWRGEAAVFRLGRALASFVAEPLRLAGLLLAFVAPAAHGPVRVAGAFGPLLRQPRGSALRHVVTRRGPPAELSTC
ncbi:hypothetical protein OG607_07425 [Streptomyces sp. NBC_01537]|uniref:hypothetical protein n=1 Tax=Streptomyces sp. NBC_01537 TaxID=2903896 RepID=UPI00386DEDF6